MDGENEKQGYLGDVHRKTLPQLRELLQRQEKLLAKQKFLDSLPDKGEKIQYFAQMLREQIREKEKREKPEMFSGLVAEASPAAARRQGLFSGPEGHEHVLQELCSDFVTLRDTLPPPAPGENKPYRHVQVNVPASGDGSVHDMTEALSEHLQSLTVSSKEDSLSTRLQPDEHAAHGEQKFQNSYEKVIKKDEHMNGSKRKETFKPNRTLKVSGMKDLPDNFRLETKMSQVNEPLLPAAKAVVPHRDCGQEVCFSEKPHEESAAHEPVYRFGKTKMISVEDSIEIQRQQKEEMERLQALHAAERLAERLHIRIGDYSTTMPDMDYRSEDLDRNNDGEAEDSDDDHDDCAT